METNEGNGTPFLDSIKSDKSLYLVKKSMSFQYLLYVKRDRSEKIIIFEALIPYLEHK